MKRPRVPMSALAPAAPPPTAPPAPAAVPGPDALTFLVQVRAPFAELCADGGMDRILAAVVNEARKTLMTMTARAAAAGGWDKLRASTSSVPSEQTPAPAPAQKQSQRK
jgi:hypothetical protein